MKYLLGLVVIAFGLSMLFYRTQNEPATEATKDKADLSEQILLKQAPSKSEVILTPSSPSKVVSSKIELTENKNPEERKLFELGEIVRSEFKAEKYVNAKRFAEESLELAGCCKKSWFYGNIIHHSNIVLGRIALADGDIKSAEKYLLSAGETPGSAQLNSFGPSMTLAKSLLEKGRAEVVLRYLILCRKFWNTEFAIKDLNQWEEDIRNHKIPEFGSNLNYD
jgi:hypothetical protein